MKYGSVCSGIEAATVAWHSLGWRPSFFAEIAKFPSALLAARWPGVPNIGDFTERFDHDAIDLLVGGTPCQSFSVAGLRGGLADERGNLALEFFRLTQRARPRWVVWENVPGVLSSNGGRDFGSILGALAELGYGFAYRVLDAQFFGVPQRRRRVFVVGCAGGWPAAAAVLFERASLRGDSPPSRAPGAEVAGSLGGGSGARGWCDDFDRSGAFIAVANTLKAYAGRNQIEDTHIPVEAFGGGASRPIDTAPCLSSHGGRFDFDTEAFVAETLRATHNPAADPNGIVFHHQQDPISADVSLPLDASADGLGCLTPRGLVRRLTPRECERLQGFPDDYTLMPGAADGPRYRALGNSMAVPVMRWIGARLAAVEAVLAARSEAA